MSLTLDLPAPLDEELNNEASKEGVSPSDHAAVLLCIATAFHDLGKADTAFQRVVKAVSESHSVDPSHLAALVSALVEYCQTPTGIGKTEAALSYFAAQAVYEKAVLVNWRNELVHVPLDIAPEALLSHLKPAEHLLQKAGRVQWKVMSEEQLSDKNAPGTESPSATWPKDFFESTFGSMEDEPLERLPQEQPDLRDEIE